MSRRVLPWSLMLSDLRADRAPRPDIREERLRTQSNQAVSLSAWRGRSGRRYVVTVHEIGAVSIDADPRLAVGLAVCRGEGLARIVAVGGLDWRQRWQPAAVQDGATELHVYRLADTPEERTAAIKDLRELSPEGGDTRHSAREGVS